MISHKLLLVIKMVASVRSESSRNCKIFLSVSVALSLSSFKSVGDNEKNAISEPEAKPDTTSSRQARMPATTAPREGVMK